MKYLHRVFFIGIFKTNSHRKRRKKHEKKKNQKDDSKISRWSEGERKRRRGKS